MSSTSNRLVVAAELYSEELISDNDYDEALGNNNKTEVELGHNLARIVKNTINSQPQLIKKLIRVLKTVQSYENLADELSKELF